MSSALSSDFCSHFLGAAGKSPRNCVISLNKLASECPNRKSVFPARICLRIDRTYDLQIFDHMQRAVSHELVRNETMPSFFLHCRNPLARIFGLRCRAFTSCSPRSMPKLLRNSTCQGRKIFSSAVGSSGFANSFPLRPQTQAIPICGRKKEMRSSWPLKADFEHSHSRPSGFRLRLLISNCFSPLFCCRLSPTNNSHVFLFSRMTRARTGSVLWISGNCSSYLSESTKPVEMSSSSSRPLVLAVLSLLGALERRSGRFNRDTLLLRRPRSI
mmetsp:Transcript_1389/g.3408  ORF Transcript_1389/g.3408 Transcript_1389/m.3408 type:complete len:272 (-) Transcript_1389:522-1337(-)